MTPIVLGLLCIALGLWGIYDMYYYVMDVVKGGLPLLCMIGGLLAALAGCVPQKSVSDDEEDVHG
ncbi:magnetosome protein MamI [Solidesulfovibrio magneticus]|uniref:Magnetosome protein MamI-1 n=1 Tax=bacterium FH-1 TaxID=1297054 RepID=M1RGA4_UNCXX|nr:magnetosome protein MamI [Solidesulfovibrio magneticus]AGG16237.1 magnetosome protein MamI-1 [bacterium FH-1]